jgi:hypothetical protein
MSRAFVREPDGSEPSEPLPQRPIPPGPNPVTEEGLARIEAELARLRALPAPSPLEARDLRYWELRRASAHLTAPPADGTVGFGSRVTVSGLGPQPRRLRIVGEDEADPAVGLIGWRAPLARALAGAEAGDQVAGPNGHSLTVEKVENGP